MKKRVLFVNDEMVMGGVARILNTMLGKINPDLFEVDVLILHAHGELLSELPSWVNVIHGTSFFDAVDVNLKEAFYARAWKDFVKKSILLIHMKWGNIEATLLKERQKLKLDENPYDIEIAAKEGFCTVFVAQGQSKRKLNWIHVDYSAQNYSIHHMNLLKRTLKKIDLNMAVSKKAAQAYQTLFETPYVVPINNPIDVDRLRQLMQTPCPVRFDTKHINLVSVARFHPQKAVDRLIFAMSKITESQSNVHLYLIGSGPLEKDLKQLVSSLHLQDHVHFLGQISNPMPYLHQADLFVLSSLYEGFPTTVIESLVAQTPVLSTNVSGVHEQLIEDETGWIVDNSQKALEEKLITLVQDVAHLRTLKNNLKDYQYHNEEIIKTFESALLGTLSK